MILLAIIAGLLLSPPSAKEADIVVEELEFDLQVVLETEDLGALLEEAKGRFYRTWESGNSGKAIDDYLDFLNAKIRRNLEMSQLAPLSLREIDTFSDAQPMFHVKQPPMKFKLEAWLKQYSSKLDEKRSDKGVRAYNTKMRRLRELEQSQ